jgi:hypothetical protein
VRGDVLDLGRSCSGQVGAASAGRRISTARGRSMSVKLGDLLLASSAAIRLRMPTAVRPSEIQQSSTPPPRE